MFVRWALFLSLLVVVGSRESRAGDLIISTFAGVGRPGFDGDGGPADRAHLNDPFDLAIDPAGNLVFSDTMNHVVRRIDLRIGKIETIVGNGKAGFSGDGGPARSASLNEPYGVVYDAGGNLYIADRLNRRVRKVDSAGTISTFAGDGGKAFGGDGGPSPKASLVEPNGLAIDPQGKRLYIADVSDHRVRSIDLKTGMISTFAGNGKGSRSGEGVPALEASIQGARAVKVGSDGTVYVVERQGTRVRAYDLKSGTVSTVAGSGAKGFSMEPTDALKAEFNGPKELAIARDGGLLIVDTENHAIRRVDLKGKKVSTIAGNGRIGSEGDGGPPTKASLARPHGVVVGPDGTIYIGDTENHRIRAIKAVK